MDERILPPSEYVSVWETLLQEFASVDGWVLFRHGSVIIVPQGGQFEGAGQVLEVETDIADMEICELGLAAMEQWGPVFPGSSHGDFNILEMKDGSGFVVTSHLDELMTFVHVSELSDIEDQMGFAFFGRHKRDLDASELEIIHWVDRRSGNEHQ